MLDCYTMKAIQSSETLGNTHPTAQHHIPQDFNPKSLQASCHMITLTSVVLPEEMYSITLHTVSMGHT